MTLLVLAIFLVWPIISFYQNRDQSVVNEEREDVRLWRVAAVQYCRLQLTRVLDLMGVAVPSRM